MINDKMFTLPNIMNKALEASWNRQELITNNIANTDTPGYQRKDISFEQSLRQQVEKHTSIHKIDLGQLQGEIVSPNSNFRHRLDGSNVDVDWEMAELAKNKIKYDAIVTQTSRHLQRLKSAVNNVR